MGDSHSRRRGKRNYKANALKGIKKKQAATIISTTNACATFSGTTTSATTTSGTTTSDNTSSCTTTSGNTTSGYTTSVTTTSDTTTSGTTNSDSTYSGTKVMVCPKPINGILAPQVLVLPERPPVAETEPLNFISSSGFAFDLVKLTELHSKDCPGCNFSQLQHNHKKKEMVFECNTCGFRVFPTTNQNTEGPFTEKEAVVWGICCSGSHFEQVKTMYAVLNIPFPFKRHEEFVLVQQGVLQEMKKALELVLKENAALEYKLAVERGNTVVINGKVYAKISVIADGGWSKRSYKHSYDATGGCAVIIGFLSGKILHIGTKIRTCTYCSRHSTDEVMPEHDCQRNWEQAALAMEAEIVLEGFQVSMEKFDLIYEHLIGDGDSSTYAKVVAHVNYPGVHIQKHECVNHAIKNLNNGVIYVVDNKEKKFDKDDCVLVANFESRLGKDARCAIMYNSENRNHPTNPTTWRTMMEDILNVPHHVFGDHSKCKEYYCKDKHNPLAATNNLVPKLEKKPVWKAIKHSFLLLAKKSDRMMWGVTTNAAEEFMSIVCKYMGGKRMNLTQKYLYNLNVYSSVFSHQFSSFWLPDVSKILQLVKPAGTWLTRKEEVTKKLEKQRKYVAKLKLKPKPLKRLRKSTKNAFKDYAPSSTLQQPADVGVDEEMLEELKARHMAGLTITVEQQHQIEVETRGQRENPEWMVAKRHRISASNCGAIFTLRDSTNNTATVEKIVYPTYNKDLAPNDPRYVGIKREPEALARYTERTGNEVQEAGAFISVSDPQLVVSPDSWVGEDGMVEVKCCMVPPLEVAMRKTSKFLLFANNDKTEVKINPRHQYFYQVVMQLGVTRRKWCDFVVYWREENDESVFDLRIIRVYLEDALKIWDGEKGIREKLLRFYEEDCLPEIADSMRVKHQPIRQPPYRMKAICEAQAKAKAVTEAKAQGNNDTTKTTTKRPKNPVRPHPKKQAKVPSSQIITCNNETSKTSQSRRIHPSSYPIANLHPPLPPSPQFAISSNCNSPLSHSPYFLSPERSSFSPTTNYYSPISPQLSPYKVCLPPPPNPSTAPNNRISVIQQPIPSHAVSPLPLPITACIPSNNRSLSQLHSLPVSTQSSFLHQQPPPTSASATIHDPPLSHVDHFSSSIHPPESQSLSPPVSNQSSSFQPPFPSITINKLKHNDSPQTSTCSPQQFQITFLRTSSSLLLVGNGVEYSNHSCYIDTTISSLFLGSLAFDSLLQLRPSDSEINKSTKTKLAAMAASLRKDHHVEAGAVQIFRGILYRNGILSSRVVQDFMDLEEFLEPTLRLALRASPFLRFSDGDCGYFYSVVNNANNRLQPLEQLLFEQMHLANVFLAQIPSPGFCVLAPKSNDSIPLIVPSPTIELNRLVKSAAGSVTHELTLSAIILYDGSASHYSSFVRDEEGWLFCDSKTCQVQRCSELLVDLQLLDDSVKLGSPLTSISIDILKILQNSYMYIYL